MTKKSSKTSHSRSWNLCLTETIVSVQPKVQSLIPPLLVGNTLQQTLFLTASDTVTSPSAWISTSRFSSWEHFSFLLRCKSVKSWRNENERNEPKMIVEEVKSRSGETLRLRRRRDVTQLFFHVIKWLISEPPSLLSPPPLSSLLLLPPHCLSLCW